jgi:nicotinamidase-related amidase
MPVNSKAAAMIDELTPMKDEIVVNKTTDSVTTGTNYLTLLRFMGIETVVVTGIVTDQCVASTVRGLADDGLQVICVEDCCAAGSMEHHDAELKIMNSIYCEVMSTDETIELIKKNL